MYAVERPSLPDLDADLPPTRQKLEALARQINGQVVKVEAEEATADAAAGGGGGVGSTTAYVTFDSASVNKSRPPIKAGLLTDDQFRHLDQQLLLRLVQVDVITDYEMI